MSSWTEWGEGALTAAEVRKLPEWTDIWLHHRDRYGEHRRTLYKLMVNKEGQKVLVCNVPGGCEYRPIKLWKNQYFTVADFS